ncbi:MAG: hypothetical protein QG669_15, partial [Patescibacteria group bacterium]|nr:hypothetical protein [Patescibacteria group bacterium]
TFNKIVNIGEFQISKRDMKSNECMVLSMGNGKKD